MSIAGNVCIDEIDTEYERLKQYLNGLFCQYTELIVGVQPAAFYALFANLAEMLVGTEVQIHWAILQIHAGHHQHPRISEGFNDAPSHLRLRQHKRYRPTSRQYSGGPEF